MIVVTEIQSRIDKNNINIKNNKNWNISWCWLRLECKKWDSKYFFRKQ